MVVVKHTDYRRFPGGFHLYRWANRCPLAPRVVAARHHGQYVAEQLHRVVESLLANKRQLAHGVGVAEKVAMAFFNTSSSWASRLLATRRARTSAAPWGSVGKGC